MMLLKQSTAVEIPLGPFLDATDGVTAETALTISQADVRLKKNGGSWAQKNDATSCTHEENGYYECPLNSTDTNTLGRLRVAVNEAGAAPVWQDFMVVPANVYDSLVLGVEWLEVTGLRAVFSVSGGTLTVKEQDGTTTQFTRTVATDPSAEPIIGAS
jgi:hypothetical protein